MVSLELILFVISVMAIASIFLLKVSENLGLPSLVLFILVGMIAGYDGLGKIYYDDFKLSQSIGIICLVFLKICEFFGPVKIELREF